MVQHDYSYMMAPIGNTNLSGELNSQQLVSSQINRAENNANTNTSVLHQAQTNQYHNQNAITATLANKIGTYIQNIHSYSNQAYTHQQQYQQAQQSQISSFNQNHLLQMHQQYHNQQLNQQQISQQQHNTNFQCPPLSQQQTLAPALPSMPPSSSLSTAQSAPFNGHTQNNFNYQHQIQPQNQYSTLSNVNNSNSQNNLASLTWNPNFLRSLTVQENPTNTKNSLKSIMQNSDLLELLLKPLESPPPPPQTNTTIETSKVNTLPSSSSSPPTPSPPLTSTQNLNFNDLISNENLKFKSLYDMDILDECLENKANKIANADSENSPSKYGNAFFGPSLWDKSELYQSDKMGVKFEYLEVDDFLNENGLNEADVEFLDHLQKFDNTTIKRNENTSNQLMAASTPQSHLSSISPSPSSSSSHSSSSAMSNQSLKNLLDTPSSTGVNSQQQSTRSMNDETIRNKEKMSQKSVPNYNLESSKKVNLFDDWNGEELSLDSEYKSEDEEEFNNSKKYADGDEAKYLNLTKKSKKKFVPDELKDEKYWARRRKNNVAAKRSRDARRMKENQIAVRATYLERENDALRKQLEDSKRENKLLKLKLARYETSATSNSSALENMNGK